MFCMQISPMNSDYGNILMSESTEIEEKGKKTVGIKGREEPKFAQGTRNPPKTLPWVAGI